MDDESGQASVSADSLNSSSSSSPDSDTTNAGDEEEDRTAHAEYCGRDLDVGSDEDSEEDSCNVPLEPFVHQVGGHFPMVCLATETICKPLNEREHLFYRTLPRLLRPFTPKFEGLMSVSFYEDEHGYITLTGHPPAHLHDLKMQHLEMRSSKQHLLLLHHHHNIHHHLLCDPRGVRRCPSQIWLKRTDSLEIERGDSPVVSRSSTSMPTSIPASSSGSPKEKSFRHHEDAHFACFFSQCSGAPKVRDHSSSFAEAENEESGFVAMGAAAGLEKEVDKLLHKVHDQELEEEQEEEIYCNPWALKCHRDHLKKLGLLSTSLTASGLHSPASGYSNAPTSQMYLLLENLVSKYKRPCVLDLKVGSRQYADDVTMAKKQRKMVKSANTTLATLGLRLCGLQVYNVNTGKYLCQNKYFGRSLTPDSFKQTIISFFNNTDDPKQLRLDVITCLIDKLISLEKVLIQLESFRFYTSSLLVTYDGSSMSLPGRFQADPVDVRIIDFAHSTHQGLKDSTLHHGPDDGFINGIQNLIRILSEIRSSSTSN